MKPAAFEYFAPDSVEEAAAILNSYGGEARVLAGGQSLVPLLNMRLARPKALVGLDRVAGLDHIRDENDMHLIGAMTRQRAVERSNLVVNSQPLLHEAVKLIAHPQIRNRGTIGGSLAHADPAAELPATAVALDAAFKVTGPDGSRTIAACDFFVTFLTTALQPDEVLTEVSFPKMPPRTGWCVQEIARRHGDFALAGAAVTVTLHSGGRCADARIALFGVAPTPLRARAAEGTLRGEALSDAGLEQASARASSEIQEPLSDIHASTQFRRHLAKVMTSRALAVAVERAQRAGERDA